MRAGLRERVRTETILFAPDVTTTLLERGAGLCGDACWAESERACEDSVPGWVKRSCDEDAEGCETSGT